MYPTFRTSSLLASSGCSTSLDTPTNLANVPFNVSVYGREASALSWARRNLAAATIFMALVICWVFFILRILRFRSFTPAPAILHHRLNYERRLEILYGLNQGRIVCIIDLSSFAYRFQHVSVGA